MTLKLKLAQAICKVKIGGPYPSDERIADAALSAFRAWLEAEGLVVVPREATVGMFRALTLSQMDNDDLKFRLSCWALGSFASDYAAMIAAAPDALKAPDPAP